MDTHALALELAEQMLAHGMTESEADALVEERVRCVYCNCARLSESKVVPGVKQCSKCKTLQGIVNGKQYVHKFSRITRGGPLRRSLSLLVRAVKEVVVGC